MKIIYITITLILSLNFASAAYILPGAGLTPSNPFHFLDRFFERVGLLFTFNNASKINRYIEISEERLAEAKLLVENKKDSAQKALNLYNSSLSNAETIAKKSGEEEKKSVSSAARDHIIILSEMKQNASQDIKMIIDESLRLTSSTLKLSPENTSTISSPAIRHKEKDLTTEEIFDAKNEIEGTPNTLETTKPQIITKPSPAPAITTPPQTLKPIPPPPATPTTLSPSSQPTQTPTPPTSMPASPVPISQPQTPPPSTIPAQTAADINNQINNLQSSSNDFGNLNNSIGQFDENQEL